MKVFEIFYSYTAFRKRWLWHYQRYICILNWKQKTKLSGLLLPTYDIRVIFPWHNLLNAKHARFPENRFWHFMQSVSLGDNLHEVSKSVFWENKKKEQNSVCWNFHLVYLVLKKPYCHINVLLWHHLIMFKCCHNNRIHFCYINSRKTSLLYLCYHELKRCQGRRLCHNCLCPLLGMVSS